MKKYVLYVVHSNDDEHTYFGCYPKLMTLVMALREFPSDVKWLTLQDFETLQTSYEWQSPEWE